MAWYHGMVCAVDYCIAGARVVGGYDMHAYVFGFCTRMSVHAAGMEHVVLHVYAACIVASGCILSGVRWMMYVWWDMQGYACICAWFLCTNVSACWMERYFNSKGL